jgi:thiol-disulfide isomerase/thioredoxin
MAIPPNFHLIESDAHFQDCLGKKVVSDVVVINFYADWAPQCEQMNEVFQELVKLHPNVDFLQIEAENAPETSENYDVAAVPSFVLLKVSIFPIDGFLVILVQQNCKFLS